MKVRTVKGTTTNNPQYHMLVEVTQKDSPFQRREYRCLLKTMPGPAKHPTAELGPTPHGALTGT